MARIKCVAWLMVWPVVCAAQNQVESLLALKTDSERTRWLEQNHARTDQAFVDALLVEGTRAKAAAEWPRALAAGLAAVDTSRRLRDNRRLALALRHSGEIHYLQGNLGSGTALIEESLDLLEAPGDETEFARSLNSLGNIRWGEGRMKEARELYERSLGIRERIGDAAGVGQSTHIIGSVWKASGDYERAVEYLKKSLVVFERLGDKRSASVAMRNVCLSLAYQAAYAEALEICQQSLRTVTALNDELQLTACLDALGNLYNFMGDWRRALEHFQRALKLREKMGSLSGIAETLNNIGLVYLAQGNPRQALAFLGRSREVNRKLGDESLNAATETNLGHAWIQQGNYGQALTALRQSLERCERQRFKNVAAEALNSIGRVYLEQQRPAEAIESLRKALALREEMGTEAGKADSLADLAVAELAARRPAEALRQAERARKIASAIGYSERQWLALTVAGRANLALGRKDEARQAFDEAIAMIEKSREQVAGGAGERSRFLADKMAPYHERIALSIAASRPAEALHFAERSRGRTLVDILQAGRVQPQKTLTPEERRNEAALRASLAALNSQLSREGRGEKPDTPRLALLQRRLQAKRLEYEAFLAAAYSAHPELKIQRGEAGIITPEEARALVDRHRAAFVEYVVTPGHTWLFAQAPGGPPRVFRIPLTASKLASAVSEFRGQLEARDLLAARNARKLYDLLVSQAASLLGPVQRLIVSPDGPLWELPFHALQSSDSRYLVESQAIVYVPSLTVFRDVSRLRRMNGEPPKVNLLAAGNPRSSGEGGEWPPLPEAEQQVAALARLYGPRSSRVYIGAEAREDRIKAEAGRNRVLHLATHGILNDESPLYSYLVLAPGGADDGLLEAWELMQLDLQAELAVLSACNSRRGRVAPGEGLIGMSWALFLAGAPSTVASQWQVSAGSTSELMVRFHRHWLRTRRGNREWSKAEALRTAATEMLANPRYRHPYWWAAFVLLGDAG
ncbi:MAG: CHAT domain-containing tetratricopeptide repeat protein [Bryobacteraceae bacterium]